LYDACSPLSGFFNTPKSVSQMIIAGRGFSRDMELPEQLGFSP
jgi:hypothetical protein